MNRFAERIAKDCKGRTGLLDFYEIRFDKAFAVFRAFTLRQIGPTVVDMVPLGSDEDDSLEISAEVEAAASDFLGADPEKIDDPAFRLELTAAIDCLPDDQKQVIGLLLQGLIIEDPASVIHVFEWHIYQSQPDDIDVHLNAFQVILSVDTTGLLGRSCAVHVQHLIDAKNRFADDLLRRKEPTRDGVSAHLHVCV
ncbi:hypothetical protein SAMN05216302_10112 [Nitrosomonas aestuarii]|uniref:Uncharacterized protein n=1 Tax=Nitrosomonas aestuarii TaxID=52441 RepID=A0A1I4B2L5_9PROT|nr:hypothetical protein [Nitrosomonas aestuarii]SFK63078.1 hypothetical protein SAMN05216302_10112 [Nitrosomonas aestuarii]